MNYGTVKEGAIDAPLAMRSSYEGIGAWHTLSDDERAHHGWYVCKVINESFNAISQYRSEAPKLEFNGELITAAYTVMDKPLATIKTDLNQRLAQHRFNFETSGLTLASGLQVLTDRESQAQLNNAYITLKNGLIPDTDWKAESGWQLSTLAEIEVILKAVAAHGRACFRAERRGQETIDLIDVVSELEAIDISGLFNTAYQEAFNEVMATEQAPA